MKIFFVLNINENVIKLLLDLYLFIIYVEYMYICVSWICMYALANMSVHVFPVIFGIENDYVIMFISHTKF